VTIGALTAVAATTANNPDYVGAGVLGFLVVAALGLALVFLVRSMNKQFRKITPQPGPGLPGDDETAGEQHLRDS
jgi:hypothetical protein